MRPGFMIYHSNMKALLNMSDKDLGVLLKLLYRVSLGEAVEPPQRLRVVFDMMAERVREDAERYEETVAKRRKAAQASVNARQQVSTHANTCQQVSTHANQSNLIQSNLIQSNRIISALDYAQRNDDMNEVMMNL